MTGSSGVDNCTKTITQTAHGFGDGDVLYWDEAESEYVTFTGNYADASWPVYVVLDSLTANTFTGVSCGIIDEDFSLPEGLYYATNTGLSLTPAAIEYPVLKVYDSKAQVLAFPGLEFDATGKPLFDVVTPTGQRTVNGGDVLDLHADSTRVNITIADTAATDVGHALELLKNNGISGSGTTGTIPVWSGSSALGDSPLTVSSGSVTATGTGFFLPPVGTTAQRPGTPTAGMFRYNTTLGYPETYGASAWLQSALPEGITNNTIRHDGTSWAVADALKTTTTGIQVATGANAGVLIQGESNVRYTSFNGVNTSAIYISQASSTGDVLIGYIGGGAVSNVYNYWQSSGNIASRGRLELGSTTGADCLTWDSYQVQAKTAFAGNSSQGGVLVSGSLLAYGGSADSYIFRGNTSFYQSESNTHNTFGISLTPTFTGTVNYTAIELRANQGKGLYQVGATPTNHLQGSTIIGDTITPAQTLHVAGTARITGSDGTGTQIMLRDADGDISNATLGSGLSLTSGTLSATATGIDSTTASNGLTEAANNIKLGGSLTENTTIAGGAYGLTVTTSGASVPGISTQSPATGVQASSTGGGTALLGITSDATTNTVLNNLTLLRNTTGTAANGIGQSLAFVSETASGFGIGTNQITSILTTAAAATATSQMVINGVSAGVTTDILTLEGNGQLKVNTYGVGTHTGTATKLLAVTSAGAVVEKGYSTAYITISAGSTFLGTTFERPDDGTPGTAASEIVGGEFTRSGSTLDYTGASGATLRISGSISFSISDNVDVYFSMFKEGVEIAETSTRITCTAGEYYTIPIPETTTAGTANDTFDLRIKTSTGNTTTTMHRHGFNIERVN